MWNCWWNPKSVGICAWAGSLCRMQDFVSYSSWSVVKFACLETLILLSCLLLHAIFSIPITDFTDYYNWEIMKLYWELVESRLFSFTSMFVVALISPFHFMQVVWNKVKEQIYLTLRGKYYSGGNALQELFFQAISRHSGSQDHVVFTCRKLEGSSVIHNMCNLKEDNSAKKV